MRWKSHVQCEVGENLEIISNSYLSRWYKLAKKKKLKGARCVAYVAGYTAINSINPFKVVKKAAKIVKSVKKVKKAYKTYKKVKKAKVVAKKIKKVKKVSFKKKSSVKKTTKKKAVTTTKKRKKGNAPRIKFTKKKKRIKFKGDEANNHFNKHAKEIMDTLRKNSYNLKEYIDDANYIIKNGQYTPELNGYVKFMGGKGHAKYGFVGLDRKIGRITTFHVKGIKELEKKAPSLGIRRW